MLRKRWRRRFTARTRGHLHQRILYPHYFGVIAAEWMYHPYHFEMYQS